MDEAEIIARLDQLAECRSQREILEANKAQRLKDAIPPEVKAELDAIAEEFDGPLAEADTTIGDIEFEVRTVVLEVGHSVKGASLHAVFSEARKTWDTKGLEGYAVAHPEVFNFQKIGLPSVAIRAAK